MATAFAERERERRGLDLDSSPKAVARHFGRLQADIIDVLLEHRSRSKNVTRHIELIDS